MNRTRIAWCALAVSLAATPLVGQDSTVMVAPGARYDTGWLHRVFLVMNVYQRLPFFPAILLINQALIFVSHFQDSILLRNIPAPCLFSLYLMLSQPLPAILLLYGLKRFLQ